MDSEPWLMMITLCSLSIETRLAEFDKENDHFVTSLDSPNSNLRKGIWRFIQSQPAISTKKLYATFDPSIKKLAWLDN